MDSGLTRVPGDNPPVDIPLASPIGDDSGPAPIHDPHSPMGSQTRLGLPTMWSLWIWAAWLFPVLFVLNGFLVPGLWLLMLLFASPVLVPIVGLVGMLPRFILKARGHSSLPAPLAPVLLIQWWACLAMILAFPDEDDGGPVPSVLDQLVGGRLAEMYERRILEGSALIVVAAWILSMVLAVVVRPSRAVDGGPPRWGAAAWLWAILAPVLLAAAVGAGVPASAAQRIPADQQLILARQRYTQTQMILTPIRGAIAKDGWYRARVSLDGCGGDIPCSNWPFPSYNLDISSITRAHPSDAALHQLAARLTSQGWTVERISRRDATGITALSPEGHRVEISRDKTSGITAIDFVSGSWWGDYETLVQEAHTTDDDNRTYRFEEWPELFR